MRKINLKYCKDNYKKEVTVRISDIPEIAKLSAQENMWIKLDGYMRGKFDN